MACPFHADRRLLAQPGRALLLAPDRKAAPAQGPSLDRGTRTGDPKLHRHRQPRTVPMDQAHRRHPRNHQALLPEDTRNRRTAKRNHQNFGIGTLIWIDLSTGQRLLLWCGPSRVREPERLRRWLCLKHKVKTGKSVRFPVTRLHAASPALRRGPGAFRTRRHDLVRKPDAGNPHVRFDERGLETRPWEPD